MKDQEDHKTIYARLKARRDELRGEKKTHQKDRAPFVLRRKPRRGRKRCAERP